MASLMVPPVPPTPGIFWPHYQVAIRRHLSTIKRLEQELAAALTMQGRMDVKPDQPPQTWSSGSQQVVVRMGTTCSAAAKRRHRRVTLASFVPWRVSRAALLAGREAVVAPSVCKLGIRVEVRPVLTGSPVMAGAATTASDSLEADLGVVSLPGAV